MMNALTAFFLGQLSLAILLFAFIKFFIFGEPPSTNHANSLRNRRHSHSLLRPSRLRHKRSAILRAGPPPTLSPSTILSKTYYNVSGHQPETVDWFNVLVAQTLAQLRTEALHDDAMLKSLSAVLNGPAKPEFVGQISVSELSLGEEFPIFSNCRIIPVDETGVEVKSIGVGTRLLARLDVDMSDAITLGVETKLVLNYPLPFVAVLPVALAVSVVRFSGTLSLSLVPSIPQPTETDSSVQSGAPQTTLAFSFLPDYRLDLSVRSLMGSRSRLQDVPKIAQLVEARIHTWLEERCVEPRYQEVVLPSIWPRRKNTRGGMDEDEDAVGMSGEDDVETETEKEIPSPSKPMTKSGTRVLDFSDSAIGNHQNRPPTSTNVNRVGESLESRMAAEGRKLLSTESIRKPGSSKDDSGPRQRKQPVPSNDKTDNLRMPGQFD